MSDEIVLAKIEAMLAKATQHEWEWCFYTKPDGITEIKTVEDVAETLAHSARQSEGTTLWGVSCKHDNLVVCHTGNGPTSEANAELIAATPATLRYLLDRVAALKKEIILLRNETSPCEDERSRNADKFAREGY